MLWRRFDMTCLTSGQHRPVSSRPRHCRRAAAVGFDNQSRNANLRCVMLFDATLNRSLLRAGNLIAGK